MKTSTLSRKGTAETDEVISPFYIDENRRRVDEKSVQVHLKKLNIAKQAFETVTGEKIASIEQFIEVSNSPAEYWRKDKIGKNIAEKKPLTLALIGEGFSVESLEEKLDLPDGFHIVFDAFSTLKGESIVWKNFSIDNSQIILSAYFLNRLNNRVYFYAVTDLQRKRLAFAKNVLALFENDWAELVEAEAKESGVKPEKIQKAISTRRYCGPIPFCLRMKIEGNGYFGPVENQLMVNEKWVVFGHQLYADEIGLPGIAPNPYALRDAKPDNTVWKRFYKTDGDGARRFYHVRQGEEHAAYSGAGREANIQFEDVKFYFRDGKFVPIELTID